MAGTVEFLQGKPNPDEDYVQRDPPWTWQVRDGSGTVVATGKLCEDRKEAEDEFTRAVVAILQAASQ